MIKAEIAKVDAPETAIQGVTFPVTVDITGATTADLELVALLVTDAAGNIVFSTTEYKAVDKDTVEIAVKVDRPGLYSLRLAVAANDVIIPATKEVPLKVSAVEPYLKSLEKELSEAKKRITKLEADKAALEAKIEEVAAERYEAGKKEGYSAGFNYGIVIGLVAGLVVGVVVARFVFKPKK